MEETISNPVQENSNQPHSGGLVRLGEFVRGGGGGDWTAEVRPSFFGITRSHPIGERNSQDMNADGAMVD